MTKLNKNDFNLIFAFINCNNSPEMRDILLDGVTFHVKSIPKQNF